MSHRFGSSDHADSAGVPWEGRRFESNANAADDGSAPPKLLEAIRRFRAGDVGEAEVVITAMMLTRPRELTRRQLRELALALDRAGFTEAGLTTAWRETTNQDIAARIVIA